MYAAGPEERDPREGERGDRDDEGDPAGAALAGALGGYRGDVSKREVGERSDRRTDDPARPGRVVVGRIGERHAVEEGAQEDRQGGERDARVPPQRGGAEKRARGDGEGQALCSSFR